MSSREMDPRQAWLGEVVALDCYSLHDAVIVGDDDTGWTVQADGVTPDVDRPAKDVRGCA
jgi:hypothetical protein